MKKKQKKTAKPNILGYKTRKTRHQGNSRGPSTGLLATSWGRGRGWGRSAGAENLEEAGQN